MALTRSVKIDVETEKLGQYDRVETWTGQAEVTRLDDGRVRVGDMTFDLEELQDALSMID